MSAELRDFDKEAALWDEHPGRVKVAKDVAAAILRNITVTDDMHVLDFGCGTGLVTLQLQPLVKNIVGMDSSHGMLDILKNKIDRLRLKNVAAKFLDLESGGTLGGSYDLAVSSMTFHHIRDIPGLLLQLFSCLVPGGRLCMADLDPDGGRFHENNAGVFHFGFDRNALRNLLLDAGFQDVRVSTAAEITKPDASGEIRTFTVFLMIARKPV